MTMLGTGFDRDGDAHRSRKAARTHHHEAAVWGLGRVHWTVGNVLRLLALIAVVAAALLVATMWGLSVGRAEAPTRTAVHAYVQAVELSDEAAMAAWSCSRDDPTAEELGLPDAWGLDDFTEAMEATRGAGLRITVGPWYGNERIRYHDFEIDRRVRGTVELRPDDGSDEWRVCGFLNIRVWKSE